MTNKKSIKKNFSYNIALRLLNIVFPLITFPYLARVLSPEGIGMIDFSTSIIQYFVIIAQVGIPTYAIRECAKVKDNRYELTKTVQEILGINFIMIIMSYIILFILVYSINKLQSYSVLLIILSFNILSTSIGVEWFYQALEEYRYIALRSTFVKLFSLAAVFAFVKNENDIIIYALITVCSFSCGYLYNFIHLYKHIEIFKKLENYDFKRHIKPILMLFAMNISVSIYINLDKIMLGFLSGDNAVGLYTAANKIIGVIIAFATSLGAVLLPRMSYYIKNNDLIQINNLIRKSLDFILMITIPSLIGIYLLAEPIILLFAGSPYIDAVLTTRIISPIIVAIALSNLIGIQVLVSHGKEKITLISTIIGAIVNFTINILLIPIMQEKGAAIGTVVAEVVVTSVQVALAYPFLKGNVNWKAIKMYLLGGGLIVIIANIAKYLINGMAFYTFIVITISIFSYFGFLYIVKNELTYELMKKILSKIKINFFDFKIKGERND